jgi:hypothetical protein
MRHVFEVDFTKVSSDSFLVNTQSILLRFAESFLDSNYSKLEEVAPDFLTTSSRLSLDETRINATSDELKSYKEELAKGVLSEWSFPQANTRSNISIHRCAAKFHYRDILLDGRYESLWSY